MSRLQGNSIGDLYGWCTENTLTAESSKHKVGVLRGWRAHGSTDILDAAVDIVLCFTTPNLLKNATRQSRGQLPSFFDLDQTYQLTESGYPVSVFGTVDASHAFKLLALGLSRHENEKHITQLLNMVKTGISELTNSTWNPQYAMADRADAIHNALSAVFPNIRKAKCYFHVKKGLRDHKHLFSNEANYRAFETDC